MPPVLPGVLPTFGKDDLKILFNYGNGLGRYMVTNFEGAQLDANTGEMELVDQWGGYAAYRHFWSDRWRTTVAYSYGEADNNVEIVGDAVNKKFQSVHGNLIWSPVPAVNLGFEYIWGYRELEMVRMENSIACSSASNIIFSKVRTAFANQWCGLVGVFQTASVL